MWSTKGRQNPSLCHTAPTSRDGGLGRGGGREKRGGGGGDSLQQRSTWSSPEWLCRRWAPAISCQDGGMWPSHGERPVNGRSGSEWAFCLRLMTDRELLRLLQLVLRLFEPKLIICREESLIEATNCLGGVRSLLWLSRASRTVNLGVYNDGWSHHDVTHCDLKTPVLKAERLLSWFPSQFCPSTLETRRFHNWMRGRGRRWSEVIGSDWSMSVLYDPITRPPASMPTIASNWTDDFIWQKECKLGKINVVTPPYPSTPTI